MSRSFSTSLLDTDSTRDRVDALLEEMTLEEKIGQMSQVNAGDSYIHDYLAEALRAGRVGSVLNEVDVETVNELRNVHVAPFKAAVVVDVRTLMTSFGDRASEANQARYYRDIDQWATDSNVTVFFFEAFDEPWTGNPANPLAAEKHWSLFNVDRTPKPVMRR